MNGITKREWQFLWMVAMETVGVVTRDGEWETWTSDGLNVTKLANHCRGKMLVTLWGDVTWRLTPKGKNYL